MRKPGTFGLSRRGLLVGATSAATATTCVAHAQTRAQTTVPDGVEGAPAISKVSFTVNGQARALELDTRTTLLDALREQLQLSGTKKGCDHGQCGACTVIVEAGGSIRA